MPLTTGTPVGPYEILAPIGAGGMGEVYRARDLRLNRDVAMKVLPAAFAQDAERLARFGREAKAVAALSHPNILAIFDTGTHDGLAFVVTELLDGEALRDRLRAGALPVRKAVEIAVQIARGLAAAHAKGIVHRDLKPENVFTLHDGQVKILDFGLARQTLTGSGATETAAGITDPGVVMGTVGYMAPEQVRGQTADARTDLFALGVVLYEMLSGERAFKCETAAETMTAILKDDPPDLGGSRPDLSPALDRIVRHCLEKNPAERFQTARDVAFALEAFPGSAISATSTVISRRRRRWPTLAASLLLGIGLIAGAFLLGRRTSGADGSTPRSFDRKTFQPQSVFNARLMPDGQTIVLSAALHGSVPELFLIRPDAAAPQPLGQARTHLLSVSSKGELAVLTGASWLGNRIFRGTLARMQVDGAPRPWLEHVSEADWAPDGSTLAIVRQSGGKDHLEYPIGTELYATTGSVSDPRVSPDGNRVAFMDHEQSSDDRGWVKVVDRARHVTMLAGEFAGEQGLAWSSDGTAVLFSAGLSWDLFQTYSVTLSAHPTPRVVIGSPGSWIYDVGRNGTWLVDRVDARVGIMVLVPGETTERDLTWRAWDFHPNLSGDGRLMLFSDGSLGGNYALSLRRTDGSPVVRLGEGMAWDLSPDGNWALGQIPTDLNLVLYPTGPSEPVHLDRRPLERVESGSFFPDSRYLLLCGNEPGRLSRCYRMAIPRGTLQPVTPEGISDGWVAPDGRTIIGKANGGYVLCTVGGAATRPALGVRPDDDFAGWSADSRAVFVTSGDVPLRLERLDLATSHRTLIALLAPRDRAGVLAVAAVDVVPDGRGYAYSYIERLSTLFTISGAR